MNSSRVATPLKDRSRRLIHQQFQRWHRGTGPELLAFARGLRSMLIDNFLEIQPGGSRLHFPMVELKNLPQAVDFFRASGREDC